MTPVTSLPKRDRNTANTATEKEIKKRGVKRVVRVTIDENLCKGCGLCVRACPKHIIELSKTHINAKGYHPAEVTNMDACIGCTSCARTCPDVVIRIEKD